MWVAHFLPYRALVVIGNTVGMLAFWLIPERRHVTRVNLEKCFPEKAPAERERLARAHFRAFCRSFALPQAVDTENIVADLVNGVLTITVPKIAGPERRRVSVS